VALEAEKWKWMQRGGRSEGNLPAVVNAMSAWSKCCVAP